MSRSRLLFNAFIITIAAVVTAYFIFVTLSQRSLLNENFQRQRELDQQVQAAAITSDLSSKVDSTLEKLSLLAEIQAIKNGSPAECDEKLGEVFDTFRSNFLDTLSRMGSDGIFDCSTTPTTPGFDGRNLPHLAVILDDSEHKPVMGPPAKSSQDGRLFTSIHVPITDSTGKFNGTIGTAMFFDELATEFISSKGVDKERVEALILYSDGRVIAHNNMDLLGQDYRTDVPELRKKINAFKLGSLSKKVESQSIEGKTFTTSVFEPVTGESWMIILISDAQNSTIGTGGLASLLVGEVWVMIIALIFVVVFAVAVVLYYTNHNIFKPFIHIQRSVDKIGSGDLAERIKKKSIGSYEEFHKLSESINEMADKLETSYKKLDEKATKQEKKAIKASGDLEKKVEELERINQLMINREEKMIELKKKLADMEQNSETKGD